MGQASKAALICLLPVVAQMAWADDACNSVRDPSQCARILSNLATVYYSQFRYGEAEPLFLRAIDLWSTAPQGSADLAITLHNLAALYRAQARYAEAIQSYERALRIRESLYGLNAAGLVPLLSGLATVYLETGNYSCSRQVNQRGLSIVESRRLEGTPDAAAALANLGDLLIAEHKYTQAERALHQAADIDRRSFPPDAPRLGYDAYQAGVLALKRRHYSVAEAELLQSAAILELHLPSNHPDIGNVNAALAEVYRREGRWEESAMFYREALQALERSLGPENPRLLATLEAYTLVLRARQEYAEAARMDAWAMKIRVTQALRSSR